MRTSLSLLFFTMLTWVVLPAMVGCGGGGPSRRIDSVHLARVPKADKDAMFDTQNRVDVAKENLSEATKADKDADDFFRIVALELDTAREKAKLAKARGKRADTSDVAGRGPEADLEAEVAYLGVETFEAKLKYARENRTFSTLNVKLAEAAVYEAEAVFELEKNRLMEVNGISVDSIDGDKIREQHAKYAHRLAKIKEKTDKALTTTMSLKAEFDTLYAAYEAGLASLSPTSAEPETPDYLPPAGPSVGPEDASDGPTTASDAE